MASELHDSLSKESTDELKLRIKDYLSSIQVWINAYKREKQLEKQEACYFIQEIAQGLIFVGCEAELVLWGRGVKLPNEESLIYFVNKSRKAYKNNFRR